MNRRLLLVKREVPRLTLSCTFGSWTGQLPVGTSIAEICLMEHQPRLLGKTQRVLSLVEKVENKPVSNLGKNGGLC